MFLHKSGRSSWQPICTQKELDRLRVMLDRHMENVACVVGKLANRLQRKLMHANRSWDFDLEEGILDAAKLHRVVTQPLSPLSITGTRHHIP